MDPKSFGKPRPPEEKLRNALVDLMRSLKWWVHITHGNAYSHGLPDLIAGHRNYGIRFIEVKNADAYHFTAAQEREFPAMMAAGVGIYVVALPVGFSEKLLFHEYESVIVNGPPNWTKYYGHSRRPF